MNRLYGKVAIITGGNAGIGEAIAKLFAEEGASVVVTGRRKEELERVVKGIGVNKGRAFAVAGSVTDESHVREVISQTIRTFGKVHILVNNAGVGDFGRRVHELDDATWSNVLDINLTGLFRMSRAAIPEIMKSGGGAIREHFDHRQRGRSSGATRLCRLQRRSRCTDQGDGCRLCQGQYSV